MSFIVLLCSFSYVFIHVKYNFSLGAHITHMPNVLDICDAMSVWSWVHVIDMFLSRNKLCPCGTRPQHSRNHQYL